MDDLQSEFQMDRADYLESIRRLEKNLKFYQQLIELSLPYLRKSGRLWDPEAIKHDSIWNEDLNKWKLPEDSMTRLRLPPAGSFYESKFMTFFVKYSFHFRANKNMQRHGEGRAHRARSES